jgi:phospholipase/lecithinase/hemolysin
MQRLVEDGARYVVVTGTPPMGCVPMALARYGVAGNATEYDRRTGCLRRLNGLSQYHNWMLQETVRRMRGKYPEITIVYADYHKPVARLIRRPGKLGKFSLQINFFDLVFFFKKREKSSGLYIV